MASAASTTPTRNASSTAGDVVDHEFEGVAAATGAVQPFRYTFTRSGPDEMVTRIFDRHEQQWRRVVELVYRRQPF